MDKFDKLDRWSLSASYTIVGGFVGFYRARIQYPDTKQVSLI
jgi:hypothetical protein